MSTPSTSRWLARLLPTTALVVGFTASALGAAEITVLSASALKVIVSELAEQFRKESGHTVRLEFATAGAVEKRILAGEASDVFIATDVQMRGIADKGLIGGTPVVIARVGVGIAIKEGTPMPDISNVEALKKTLLAVKSVKRDAHPSFVWGEVMNALGDKRTARIKTANGYSVTATGALAVAEHLLGNCVTGGAYTPAKLVGSHIITRLPGSGPMQIS